MLTLIFIFLLNIVSLPIYVRATTFSERKLLFFASSFLGIFLGIIVRNISDEKLSQVFRQGEFYRILSA